MKKVPTRFDLLQMSSHWYSVCSVGVGGEPLVSALSRLLSPLESVALLLSADTCSWLLGHLLAPTWNRPFLQDPFLPVGSGVWRPNSGGGTRDLPQGSSGGGSWEDCLTERGHCGHSGPKKKGPGEERKRKGVLSQASVSFPTAPLSSSTPCVCRVATSGRWLPQQRTRHGPGSEDAVGLPPWTMERHTDISF